MPKISEERREARRGQILDAARACVLDQGLEAVSMEAIIARSGLSTGTVYRYFKGKDEVLRAAVIESTSEIGAIFGRIVADPDPVSPSHLVEKLLNAWVMYSASRTGAADRMPVAVHVWGYALTDAEAKGVLEAGFQTFREQCVPLVKLWQADGVVDPDVDPHAVAELIVSIALGFVVQRAFDGVADAQVHSQAVAALGQADPRPTQGEVRTP
jgi:AcrR family transcriptional regulator